VGCELTLIKSSQEVKDERVKIIGPDLQEMKEGQAYPLGILVEVAGEKLEKDFEPIIERQIHEYLNFIRGFMHIGSRNIIWCRVSRESFEKGLRLEHLGKTLVTLFKKKMPIIEKIQVTLMTTREGVEGLIKKAEQIYSERDARIKGLTDEEVDEFYGCILCQSFAPNHVCVITPERISNCGAITWLDAKTSTKINPTGPNFVIPKGEVLDAFRGEFKGVNEVVKKKSHGATERVHIYSMFKYPHTSCGCFEALIFYIPEVDGLGVVHREFPRPAVNKLKFSTMAGETGGGRQIFGFFGIGIEYLRSKKFLRADGGFNRVVWMPKKLKERVKDAIPEELYDKIATEEDVKDINELKRFLVEKAHPIVKRWEEGAKQ
jgi:acetyl-CoA decarbonylase/synthase complex subunit beta